LLKVNEVEFQVCQRIILNNHYSNIYDLLEKHDHTGIEPGCEVIQTKRMTLDLSLIKFKVKPTKLLSGIGILRGEVPRSKEEIFLLS
jgi:hypothetical protein